jgi:hypothetical protein
LRDLIGERADLDTQQIEFSAVGGGEASGNARVFWKVSLLPQPMPILE